MSTTVGGIRIVDLPDLGVFTSDSSLVGEHAGSGLFSAASLGNYFATAGGFVPAINPITKTYGMQGPWLNTDPYVSPDSYALTGSMTLRGQPYGYYDTGALLSLVTTTLPLGAARAGINGGFEVGMPAIAAIETSDMVNLYVGVAPAAPPLVLHNVTYDAVHIFPHPALTAAQMTVLRKNMWVITNSIDTTISATPAVPNGVPPERHYASYVTDWATDGTSITVTGWTVPGSGHTAGGQVPSGTRDPGAANATAYFGAPTNVFGANIVMQHNSTERPDVRTRYLQGIELDFQNYDAIDYKICVKGISMTYNAIGGGHLTSDSYGMLIGAFPTCLILGQYPGFTQVIMKSDAFNIIKIDSPTPWAGTPLTNLTWEAQNFIDSSLLRLQCWTSRDTGATTGWQSASVHLGLRVDGTQMTMTGGSPMGQIVWNPQLFQGGVQIQNQAGVAGLTVDSNAYLYPRVANYANDAAAAAAAVPVGAMYRNGGVLQVRLV